MQLRRDIEDYLLRIRELSELQNVINEKNTHLSLLAQVFTFILRKLKDLIFNCLKNKKKMKT